MKGATMRMVSIVAAIMLPSVWSSAQTDFCRELRSLAAEGHDDFRSIRGARQERVLRGWSGYESTRALPGADKCVIDVRNDGGEATFDCDWRIANEVELDRQFTRFVEAVPMCFPDAKITLRPERPSEFDPGSVSPASARFRLGRDVVIGIRKYTRASTATGRSRISLVVRRGSALR